MSLQGTPLPTTTMTNIDITTTAATTRASTTTSANLMKAIKIVITTMLTMVEVHF